MIQNYNWVKFLESQQEDFRKRLKLKSAISQISDAEIHGYFGESMLIFGKELYQIKNYALDILSKIKLLETEKTKLFSQTVEQTSEEMKKRFRNELIGKLGKAALKKYLGELISEVNLEILRGGDNKVDFYLASNPLIHIQVKTRQTNSIKNIDTIEWKFSREELEKNTVFVCLLTLDDVDIFNLKHEYNIINMGFKPTYFFKDFHQENIFLRTHDLLYAGGLKAYLELIGNADNELKNDKIHNTFLKISTLIRTRKHEEAITNINQALRLIPEPSSPIETDGNLHHYYNIDRDWYEILNQSPIDGLYSARAFCYSQLENTKKSIKDCTKAIDLNPKNPLSYFIRANALLKQIAPALNDSQERFHLEVTQKNFYSEVNKVYSANFEQLDDIFAKMLELNEKVLYESSTLEKLIKDYDKAIELNPLAYFYYKWRSSSKIYLRFHATIFWLLELRLHILYFYKNEAIAYQSKEEQKKRINEIIESYQRRIIVTIQEYLMSAIKDLKQSMKLSFEASDLKTYKELLTTYLRVTQGEYYSLHSLDEITLDYFHNFLGDDLPF